MSVSMPLGESKFYDITFLFEHLNGNAVGADSKSTNKTNPE